MLLDLKICTIPVGRSSRLKYLVKLKMDLVQISKFSKTVCAIVISLKIWSACPYLFSKNMRSSSAFGDKNGHAYQIFTLITIAVFENFEIETKIIHPQSLLQFQQIFQSTNRIMDQKLTSKFFKIRKFYKISEKRLSPTIR